MSLLGRLFARKGFADDVRALLLGAPARAGVSVTWATALQVSAVLACVRVIAEGTAQIPLRLMRERDRVRAAATDHPLHVLLHRAPNAWMTSFEFRELLTMHAALAGNGFALVIRDGARRVRELLPVPPGIVTVKQEEDWTIRYEIRWPKGGLNVIPRDGMLHIRGPSWDGVRGLDATRLARESVGLAMASEAAQAQLLGNGGMPSGLLTTEQSLKPADAQVISDAWAKNYGGDNRGKVAVLWAGMKFSPLSVTSADAQTLETRRLQTEEVARAWRVFPHMIGAGQQATTYASAEAFFTAHVVHTLAPWIERWEQVLDRDLLTDADRRDGLYAKFFVQGLLRGNTQQRAQFYQSGIQSGWLTRNEARELEDLNPLPGLDEPLQPLNMAPATDQPPAREDER